MRASDLHRAVDRELKRLPSPRAPRTLLPRVMAAVQAWARRPWYERAWFTWPVWLQAGSIAALLLVLGGVALVLPAGVALLDAVAARAAAAISPAGQLFQEAESTVEGARVLWRALLQPLAGYVFFVVLLMCLACAAFGAAINRVVVSNRFDGRGAHS